MLYFNVYKKGNYIKVLTQLSEANAPLGMILYCLRTRAAFVCLKHNKLLCRAFIVCRNRKSSLLQRNSCVLLSHSHQFERYKSEAALNTV